MGQLYHLLYVSRATRKLTQDELAELQRICVRKNAARHITGLLLYGSGNFLQLLEGQRLAVDLLFRKIKTDDRHCDVHLLAFEEASERVFRDFNVAFLGFDESRAVDLDELESISRAFSHPVLENVDTKKILALISEFRNQLAT